MIITSRSVIVSPQPPPSLWREWSLIKMLTMIRRLLISLMFDDIRLDRIKSSIWEKWWLLLLLWRDHLFIVIMMRGAMEPGLVNCMASMASVVDEARAHLVEPVDTVFYEPFKNMTGKKAFVQWASIYQYKLFSRVTWNAGSNSSSS